jgi:hypothetical protein
MPEANFDECQATYLEMLRALDSGMGLGSYFYRRLDRTQKCDKFKDLKDVREKYEFYVKENSSFGAQAMDKALNYNEDLRGDQALIQATIHHRDWMRKRLKKSLCWTAYISYMTRRDE